MVKALTVQQITELSGGRLLKGDTSENVTSVCTDTRNIPQGALFVALIGKRFDAHDFLQKAIDAGAGALLVSRVPEGIKGCSVILVDDTLTGLQQLAKGYRKLLPTKAVVITGSNGKTSTKDMIRGVLESKFQVTATLGNLNNHIGLPLTVLSTNPEDDFGIWEIGMNHPGEIAPLAEIAAADIAVITNIGTAHIGNMGSREAIAHEKGMLAESLTQDGLLVMNANDPFTSSISARTSARVMPAGIDAGEVQASDLEMLDNGTAFDLSIDGETARVALPIPGKHMVSNALLAAAVGQEAGLTVQEIAKALSAVHLTPGRLQMLEHEGVRVINDAYNANPDSMRASLTTVGAMKTEGKRFAILGEMGELGDSREEAHREIGLLAAAEGFDHVCSVSDGARGFTEDLSASADQTIHHFNSKEAVAAFLMETARPGDLVLLKGSRSAAMDTIYKLYATTSS
jgi:UDP-N-acetylmuramoyl-tripeptide--D-alanyl-D-alanine ligase